MRRSIAVMSLFCCLLGCLGIPKDRSVDAAGSVPVPTGQHTHQFETEIRKTVKLGYWLYLPEDYNQDPNKKWPLILFLHGSGERGADLNKVLVHGPPRRVSRDGVKLPFIIVSPQCPKGLWWTADHVTEGLKLMLEGIGQKYRVDPNRRYLTGLSMGGFGTWKMASRYPDSFAAIAPICGGGEPIFARRMKNMPVWIFHGDKDKAVPVERSHQMAAAMKKHGGQPKLTVYPDLGHDAWTQTYANPKLYEWFLSHRRRP